MQLPNLMLRSVPLLIVALFLTSCNAQMSKEAILKAKKRDLEARLSMKGKIVYAIKDIPEGTLIPGDALEEREIEMSKIPQDALTSRSLARGYYTKYGISQGQIVSQYDLAPIGNNEVVLKLDSLYMNKLKALAGGKANNCSQVAQMLLKNQLDMIETVNTSSYYESAED